MRAEERMDHRVFQPALAGLCADPGRLAEIRLRLGSVRWFMRFLNESDSFLHSRGQ